VCVLPARLTRQARHIKALQSAHANISPVVNEQIAVAPRAAATTAAAPSAAAAPPSTAALFASLVLADSPKQLTHKASPQPPHTTNSPDSFEHNVRKHDWLLQVIGGLHW